MNPPEWLKKRSTIASFGEVTKATRSLTHFQWAYKTLKILWRTVNIFY